MGIVVMIGDTPVGVPREIAAKGGEELEKWVEEQQTKADKKRPAKKGGSE